MNHIQVLDLGLKPYLEVLSVQELLFNKNIEAKLQATQTANYLILCEHTPVFTLGKSGKRENILVSDNEMNAEFYHVNRGGDVTFHGPGQLVVYPVLDLDLLHIGLAQYILLLEECIIQSLEPYKLKGERLDGAAGIWLKGDVRTQDRKIGAIGVKASRNVTMHGIAVNVNTDLSYFGKITPCGLQGKGTTSLQNELRSVVSFHEYKTRFIAAFEKVFQTTVTTAN